MGEKRGGTGKLKYDFPTQAGLFIQLSSGNWVQTSPNTFRSWNGNRKYHMPSVIVLRNVDVPIEEVVYQGPVYRYGTNTIEENLTALGLIGDTPTCKRKTI
jgi:hypothetical protein